MKSLVKIVCILFSLPIFAQTTTGASPTVSPGVSSPRIVGESSTNLGAVDESTPSSFSVSLFSLGGFQDTQFREKNPSMAFFDNYLSLNYKINRDVRVSARPAFGYNTAGRNNYGEQINDKMYTRDFSFVLKISNLVEDSLPAALSLANQFRLYLPSSDGSKESGMIARLRYEIEGKYRFTKYSNFRYFVKPSYYFQRTTAYLNSRGSARTTPKIDLEHGGEFSLDINKYFAAKPGFEIGEKWSHTSEAENLEEYRTSQIRTGFGIEFRPNRSMSFTVAMNDTRDLIRPENKAGEMGTGYTLMTNISLY